MLKLGKLQGWEAVEDKKGVRFDNPRPRRVEAEIRTAERVPIFADFGEGPLFVAAVDGYERVEFFATGAFDLYGDGHFLVRSADSTRTFAIDETQSFTKAYTKPQVAPEILAMQKYMQLNIERMRSAMAADLDLHKRTVEHAIRKRDEKSGGAASGPAAAGAGVEERLHQPDGTLGASGGKEAASEAAGASDASSKRHVKKE